MTIQTLQKKQQNPKQQTQKKKHLKPKTKIKYKQYQYLPIIITYKTITIITSSIQHK